jgi:hypothetical protein
MMSGWRRMMILHPPESAGSSLINMQWYATRCLQHEKLHCAYVCWLVTLCTSGSMHETNTIIFTEHQPVIMEDMCNYWFSIIHGGTPQDHEPLDHKFVDSPSPAPKARPAPLGPFLCRMSWIAFGKTNKTFIFWNKNLQNNVHWFETNVAWVRFWVLFDFKVNFTCVCLFIFLHPAGVDASREAWQLGPMTRGD